MEEEYMEKASGETFARTTRNTDEDAHPADAPSQGTWWNYALRWRWKLGVELVVKIVLRQRSE
jgi:hypothetical protein